MRVAFTSYPPGQHEVTSWYDMPNPPAVGDTVHVDNENIAAFEITHVSWVQEDGVWHLECSVR